MPLVMPGDLTGMRSNRNDSVLRLRCALELADRFGIARSVRVIIYPAYDDDYVGRVHFGNVAAAGDVVLWSSGEQEQ